MSHCWGHARRSCIAKCQNSRQWVGNGFDIHQCPFWLRALEHERKEATSQHKEQEILRPLLRAHRASQTGLKERRSRVMPTLVRRKVPHTLSPIPLPFPSVFSGITVPSTCLRTPGKKEKQIRALVSSCSCLSMVIQSMPGHWSFRLPDEAVECICALCVWVYGGLHLAAFLRPLLSP